MTASIQAVGSFFRQLNYNGLLDILMLPNEKCSDVEKSELLVMLSENLCGIIKDGKQLETILNYLNTPQKIMLISSLKENLPRYTANNKSLADTVESIQAHSLDELTEYCKRQV